MIKNIAIACDHGGYELKEAIKNRFGKQITFTDLGTDSSDSVDYPDYAHKLAEELKEKQDLYGIAICGSGIGISISLNRHEHIRAALCTNVTMARLTRQHNDANVLALGARITGQEAVFDIIETFINTEFDDAKNSEGRHQRRIEKITP